VSGLRDPHLGDLVAALVDGELDHDARDRALSHLAHCAPCREEVDAHRRVKRRLHELPDPSPGVELADRLQALATEPPPGAARGPRRGRRGIDHPAAGAPPRRPRRTRRARVPSARPLRVRWTLAGGASLLALGVAAVLAGGNDPGAGRPITPPVDRFVVEHVATSGELPLTDPAAGAATMSFASVGP
jgi:anti-sigma factor RsiW